MNMVYSKPVTVAELGTSDHNMVLLKPSSKRTLDTGNLTRMSVWVRRKSKHLNWRYHLLVKDGSVIHLHIRIKV